MRIVVATRSRNDELYDMMRQFIPHDIECVKIEGMNNYKDALWYLIEIMQLDADYVINCDEDCFIYDWAEVLRIIDKMETENLDYCGMPDSLEYCSHRNNAKHVMNPFFNIFKIKTCRQVLSQTTNKQLLDQPSVCRFAEPFNGLFYRFSLMLFDLPLHTSTLEDGISTDTGFALHSWYSREFNGDHRQRILDVYEEARNRCTLQG